MVAGVPGARSTHCVSTDCLRPRSVAPASNRRESDPASQRTNRAGSLSHLPLSPVVYDTSQTIVGGTGHQAGTAACCQRDGIGLLSALTEQVASTTPRSASGWMSAQLRNDVRSHTVMCHLNSPDRVGRQVCATKSNVGLFAGAEGTRVLDSTGCAVSPSLLDHVGDDLGLVPLRPMRCVLD
jgi:hypothetical protein